jgi:hypothetical protein
MKYAPGHRHRLLRITIVGKRAYRLRNGKLYGMTLLGPVVRYDNMIYAFQPHTSIDFDLLKINADNRIEPDENAELAEGK